MKVNVLVAISATGTTAIRERLSWNEETQGEYSGVISKTEHAIFKKMHDVAIVQSRFRKPTIAGKSWRMFSLNFEASNKAKEALDWIAENRAGHFYIMGAWWYDGRQVGTQFVYDEEGIQQFDEVIEDEIVISSTPQTTGTPTYPINSAQLLKFMPLSRHYGGVNGEIVTTTPATELTDVNLVMGQKPRLF